MLRGRLAEEVFCGRRVRGVALAAAIAVRARGPTVFAAGVAQTMMLGAWNERIGSCPNGLSDADGVARVLGLVADERPVIVLTFGYPARSPQPQARSPQEWIARVDRKPFQEVVRRL